VFEIFGDRRKAIADRLILQAPKNRPRTGTIRVAVFHKQAADPDIYQGTALAAVSKKW
jgi:hypothetical protein